MFVIECKDLQFLIVALQKNGFVVVGPTFSGGAITYDEISSLADFPVGYHDDQTPGHYRLRKTEDQTLFSHTVGPQSWKKYLFPPSLRLFRARKKEKGFLPDVQNDDEGKKYAFVGVRSCELHAIEIQDRVFSDGQYIDSHYRSVRERLFVVAVNCGRAVQTCFCVSMKTGPRATRGFDLSLTEIKERDEHYFVVEVGTEKGNELITAVPHQPAERRHIDAAHGATRVAEGQITKTLNASGLETILPGIPEHPRWDDVGKRCLSCSNCTLVCPTCFCATVEDVADLAGQEAERWRKWDSCFALEFSYIHGGSVRQSVKSRYRQWLTHKLASWVDQFGTSGCVGCGRCITWCPVGIDITEEVHILRESHPAHNP